MPLQHKPTPTSLHATLHFPVPALASKEAPAAAQSRLLAELAPTFVDGILWICRDDAIGHLDCLDTARQDGTSTSTNLCSTGSTAAAFASSSIVAASSHSTASFASASIVAASSRSAAAAFASSSILAASSRSAAAAFSSASIRAASSRCAAAASASICAASSRSVAVLAAAFCDEFREIYDEC